MGRVYIEEDLLRGSMVVNIVDAQVYSGKKKNICLDDQVYSGKKRTA